MVSLRKDPLHASSRKGENMQSHDNDLLAAVVVAVVPAALQCSCYYFHDSRRAHSLTSSFHHKLELEAAVDVVGDAADIGVVGVVYTLLL